MALPFKSCFPKILPLFDWNGQRVIARCWCYQTWLKVCWVDLELLPSCQYAHFGPLWVHQSSPGWSEMHLELQLMRLKPCFSCLCFWMWRFVLQPLLQFPLDHLLLGHPPLHHLEDELVSWWWSSCWWLRCRHGVDILNDCNTFALKILMRRLGKISLGLKVVLVSSTIVSYMWKRMSMKVFSLSSMRKIALALLIVVSFLTRYKLNIMMVVRHLMSTRNAVVLRHPPLYPSMRF